MTVLLEIDALTGGYHDTKVISGLTARIDRGMVLGVFGRNGVGKTTFARLVQGTLAPASGTINLNGTPISSLRPYERRRLGIGYMPQTSMVFDDLTVRENLTLSSNGRAPDPYFERFPRLAERLDQLAGTMSGGERKILAFVRTMVEDTQLIILDEPSEGVQPENIDHMAACIRDRALNGAGVMLCEQNLGLLREISDQYLGLDAGAVVLSKNESQVTETEIQAILTL